MYVCTSDTVSVCMRVCTGVVPARQLVSLLYRTSRSQVPFVAGRTLVKLFPRLVARDEQFDQRLFEGAPAESAWLPQGIQHLTVLCVCRCYSDQLTEYIDDRPGGCRAHG